MAKLLMLGSGLWTLLVCLMLIIISSFGASFFEGAALSMICSMYLVIRLFFKKAQYTTLAMRNAAGHQISALQLIALMIDEKLSSALKGSKSRKADPSRSNDLLKNMVIFGSTAELGEIVNQVQKNGNQEYQLDHLEREDMRAMIEETLKSADETLALENKSLITQEIITWFSIIIIWAQFILSSS